MRKFLIAVVALGAFALDASAQCANGRCDIPGPAVSTTPAEIVVGQEHKSPDGKTYYQHPDGVYREAKPAVNRVIGKKPGCNCDPCTCNKK